MFTGATFGAEFPVPLPKNLEKKPGLFFLFVDVFFVVVGCFTLISLPPVPPLNNFEKNPLSAFTFMLMFGILIEFIEFPAFKFLLLIDLG